MVTSKVYQGAMSKQEIAQIIDYFDKQPEITTETGIVNKNLEYHIPDNFITQMMYPKITSILGEDHEFDTGSYKSSRKPYIIHVDSRQQHDQYPDCMSFGSKTIRHNKAILVPLVEGDELRTVTFQVWTDLNPTKSDLLQNVRHENYLVSEEFGHQSNFEFVRRLPIDIDYRWRLGDILVWDRNQWHMSNDFNKYGITKTFLVFFMS